MKSPITDEMVTSMAHQMVVHGGGDPSSVVQIGEPVLVGTPAGVCFRVSPGSEVQMWTLYRGSARIALEMAAQVIDPIKLVPLGNDNAA